ncbi:hypothetical protein [Levilactobacillus brevis]|uniref:hypothetical protein n=1 Tax=Levilactobacillus brevis TaxID=1580 RepID=UPI001161F708|nr:hypothetical protein [Levilactobacillus brevis]MBS0977446.1 hypothetical protein [Levilactobacillus brevis]QCZ43751.1 hypothetical protein UCCLBBS124_1427 [Levilactobacillus brevis]
MAKQRKRSKRRAVKQKKRRMAEHAREHQPVAVTAPKTRVKPVVRKYKVTSTNGLYNV